MDISEVINIILGGGLVGTVATIGSLRATVRKTKVEASKSGADAGMVRIDNAESATCILMENTIKLLKNEFSETKEELSETKRELTRNTCEMARPRKTLDGADGCEHRDGCPILDRLHEQPKERDRERGGTDRGKRQHRDRDAPCDGATGTKIGNEPDPECGQPPWPPGRRVVPCEERPNEPRRETGY